MVKKETIAEGRTVDAAVSLGAEELGTTPDRVTYEIIETPKRGFLGFGETPAKVKVIYQTGPEDVALNFIKTVIADMGISAGAEISRSLSESGDRQINIYGEEAGLLIGHHGDTLDSLQFLTNLAVNKGDDDEDSDGYTRIVVDVENYRAKREETLRTLARSMASRVKKYHKNITLEPMNPYERRIIHSEIQTIAGVSTISIGQDTSRRVVIYYEENGKPAQLQAQQAAADALKQAEKEGTKPQSGSGSRRGGKKSGKKTVSPKDIDAEIEEAAEASEAVSSEDEDREEALSVLRAQKGRRRGGKKQTPAAVSSSADEESGVYDTTDSSSERRYDRRDNRGDRRGQSSGGSRPKKNKTEDLIAQTIASYKAENHETVEEPKDTEFKTQAVVDDSPIIMNANAGSDE